MKLHDFCKDCIRTQKNVVIDGAPFMLDEKVRKMQKCYPCKIDESIIKRRKK